MNVATFIHFVKQLKALMLFLCSLVLLQSCSMKNYSPKTEEQAYKKIYRQTREFHRLHSKASRKFVDDLQFIPSGSCYTMPVQLKATETDTTLLTDIEYKNVSVKDFYISNHEVTVKEYLQFVYWVRDSMAMQLLVRQDSSYYADKENEQLDWRQRNRLQWNEWVHSVDSQHILSPLFQFLVPYGRKVNNAKFIYNYISAGKEISVPVYPDTLVLGNEFAYLKYSYEAQNYFKYENRPVVGVTWYQANAYCHWLTNQYRKTIAESGINNNELAPTKAEFRLPTEAEWAYAAGFSIQKKSGNKIEYNCMQFYPWKYNYPTDKSDLTDEKGNYLARFGEIIDQNEHRIKSISRDLTANVKSYRPNSAMVYDMGGNVAEWTSDTVNKPNHNIYLYLYQQMLMNFLYQSSSGYKHRKAVKDSLADKWAKLKETLNYAESMRAQQQIIAKRDSLSNSENNNGYVFNKENEIYVNKLLDSISSRTTINGSDSYTSAMQKMEKRDTMIYQLAQQLLGKDKFTDEEERFYWANQHFSFKNVNKFNNNEVQRILHNITVYNKNPNHRIVKGGSWANGPAYMQISAREIFSEDKSSSRIGFRVVMVVERKN